MIVAAEMMRHLAGNRKDVCVKEANAELVEGKAHAKASIVVADTHKETSMAKQADASEGSEPTPSASEEEQGRHRSVIRRRREGDTRLDRESSSESRNN